MMGRKRRDDLDRVITYAYTEDLEDHSTRRRLRILWMEYCFKYGIRPGDKEYDRDLEDIWYWIEDDCPDTDDWDSYLGYDSFEAYMSDIFAT